MNDTNDSLNDFYNNFYRRFNLKPEEFHRRDFQISGSGSIRETLLKSELEDFQYLAQTVEQTVEEINTTQKKLLERFQIEGRNTFSIKVKDTYMEFIMGTENLRLLLEKEQLHFYKQRIDEIIGELENI